MAYSTQTLAAGCFGKIYKEKYGDTWAAVKRVPLGVISQQQLERECKVYHNARHKNVVKLLGEPWIKYSKWNIPLEFIFGEDLETTIFKVQLSKIQLTPAVKATIITGMCEGLLYLHSKDIVHQDLKPDNIMVEHQTHHAVIIDLGLAKFFRKGLTSAVNLGNEAYSAPEILQNNGIRDKRSDVWAMGKIIAELCARIRLPTQFVSPIKIRETLKDQPYCNPVSRMVEPNPIYRTTMAGVITDIRRAASAQPTDIRPKDITRDFTRDNTRDFTRDNTRDFTRDNTRDFTRDNTRDFTRDITRDNTRDFTRDNTRDFTRDITRDNTRDFTRDFTRDNTRDFTVTHGNDIRLNQKWCPPGPPVPKIEVNKPPMLYYRQDRPQQREMGKAMVPVRGEALNKQLSLMSFPCPLPETGKVTQERYTEEKGAVEYKEIVTKGGRIIKYEKVQITKDS